MDDSSLKQLFDSAEQVVKESPLCVRTPLIADCWKIFSSCIMVPVSGTPSSLSLKLEHMQNFGSFKIRGIVNQFQSLPENVLKGDRQLVTMSAGNYGRSFAEACCSVGVRGLVVLPDFAPKSRAQLIESKGLSTERVAGGRELLERVKYHEENGLKFLHPFDDPHLFYGYGSVSQEIYESQPNTDVIVTCCGGGGLLAGVAGSAKLYNPNCKVYGVEPINANCMYRSFEAGEAVSLPDSRSIAAGLSPPYAGKQAYAMCKDRVEQILLVSEMEIIAAVKALFNKGLVVEPSGAAPFAALMFQKIPDISDKNLVIILTGRNVSVEEMVAFQ